MKSKILGIAFVLILFSCKKEEKTSAVGSYNIEQFMDNESVSGGSFSSDNSKMLVSSNRTGIFNAYTLPAQGGELTAVTASDSTSYFSVSFFPKDDRILLSADGNGDEINHLYVKELNGEIRDITPDEGAKAGFYGWSKDKTAMYYGSNKRDPRFFDVYKLSIEDYTSQMIYQNNTGMELSDISDDENYFALVQTINTNDSDLYIFNVKTQETIKVNDNLSRNSAQDFTSDNSKFYYTTDDGSEFTYLMSMDLNTKEKKKVLEKKWDISSAGFSPDYSYMTIFVNEDAKNAIEVLDAKTMQPIELPDFENKSITSVGFSMDEKWMRMYIGGSHTPSNLYSYSLEDKTIHQLTDVLNKDIKAEDLVEAKVIRYPSFDGVEIPAIYYLPKQASVEDKVPAMVWVHGGPGGQSRQGFSSFIQYMVNSGYAILAVNNRGSSGYGKTFFQMDDQNHGDKDLKDCIEGKNWLAKQPEINPEKIGIIGGSYGGFMTMAALTNAPEEFDVGVNLFGVTNWLRTLKSIPPYWEAFREALYKEMGDPFTQDSIRLRQISPLFHTEKVTKPLIVLQGSQDPRVLQVESDEIVEGVKANGVPVEYVLFEDEGHGFVKKKNQIEAYSRIVKFLDKYLKGQKTLSLKIKDKEVLSVEM